LDGCCFLAGITDSESAYCGRCYYQGDHLSGKPGNVGNYTDVREMSGISLKVMEMSGKNLVMENCLKTWYM